MQGKAVKNLKKDEVRAFSRAEVRKIRGPVKVGKYLRDLLLRQDETTVFSDDPLNPPTRCSYYGEEYGYEAVTAREVGKVALELLDHLEKFSHKGFERWAKILLLVAAMIMLTITLGAMRI